MKYEEQERKIYAKYDDKTIRVYQAHNNVIAGEAIKLGTFQLNKNDLDKTFIPVDDVQMWLGRKRKSRKSFGY